MHPVHWTQSDGDTCPKMNTCHHLNGSNTTGPNLDPKRKWYKAYM